MEEIRNSNFEIRNNAPITKIQMSETILLGRTSFVWVIGTFGL